MKEIPFFYYDIIARFVPGGLLLIALHLLRLDASFAFAFLFDGSETWKAVVDPFIVAGAAYGFGSLLEVLLRNRFSEISDYSYKKAKAKQAQLYPECTPNFSRKTNNQSDMILREEDEKAYRLDVWQWLTVKIANENLPAFSHAHRFQCESKMFLHAAIPVSFLVTVGVFRYFGTERPYEIAVGVLALIISLSIFVFCVYLCEIRRWIQALAAADQLGFIWRGRNRKYLTPADIHQSKESNPIMDPNIHHS
jgi:hypothetical protein